MVTFWNSITRQSSTEKNSSAYWPRQVFPSECIVYFGWHPQMGPSSASSHVCWHPPFPWLHVTRKKTYRGVSHFQNLWKTASDVVSNLLSNISLPTCIAWGLKWNLSGAESLGRIPAQGWILPLCVNVNMTPKLQLPIITDLFVQWHSENSLIVSDISLHQKHTV